MFELLEVALKSKWTILMFLMEYCTHNFQNTGRNSSLSVTGEHNDGKSEYCGEQETVDHVL